MAFNTQPLKNITIEDKKYYQKNGVVCLRNVFDPDWINSLVPMARKITIDEEDIGLLPSSPGRYMSRIIPEFRKFVFDSPMAQAAAQVIQSTTARRKRKMDYVARVGALPHINGCFSSF